MDREDLFTDEGIKLTNELNVLIENLYSKDLYMSSWYGSLPSFGLQKFLRKILKRNDCGEEIGKENKAQNYEVLPNAFDDKRIPWFLYWEIFWVLKHVPELKKEMKLLDAGGSSSLFTCYLSSLGHELYSVDMNEKLTKNSNYLSKILGWRTKSYNCNLIDLPFENEYFDHAYSICVFEHMDFETRQKALAEIARCLKPGGILSLTFDYKNPHCYIYGQEKINKRSNQLIDITDVKNNFLSNPLFEVVGNEDFHDNGKLYLKGLAENKDLYTFGAVKLKKRY